MSKELAIMTEPKYGMRDMGSPAFWFSVSFGADLMGGALIVLSIKEMGKAIKDAAIYELKNLNNHPCQIEVENNCVNFVKILSI